MTTLPDLPVEIFHTIIDHFPPISRDTGGGGDLTSLRLACREIELKTRVRFGKESFYSLRLGPHHTDLKYALKVTRDDSSRNCADTLDLSNMNSSMAPMRTEEVQSMVDYMTHGDFSSDLDNIVTRLARLQILKLVTPSVRHGTLLDGEVEDEFINCWHKMTTDVLATIFKTDHVKLKALILRAGEGSPMATSVQVFRAISTDSSILDDLQVLELRIFWSAAGVNTNYDIEAGNDEITIQDATNALRDFFVLTKKPDCPTC